MNKQEEFLKYGVGPKLREATVIGIEKIPVEVPIKDEHGGMSGYSKTEKICFTVQDINKKEFQISDVWVDTESGPKIRGLWFTLSDSKKLSPSSSSAKMVEYYNVQVLNELLNKKIKVYPDSKNYLVIVASDKLN